MGREDRGSLFSWANSAVLHYFLMVVVLCLANFHLQKRISLRTSCELGILCTYLCRAGAFVAKKLQQGFMHGTVRAPLNEKHFDSSDWRFCKRDDETTFPPRHLCTLVLKMRSNCSVAKILVPHTWPRPSTSGALDPIDASLLPLENRFRCHSYLYCFTCLVRCCS